MGGDDVKHWVQPSEPECPEVRKFLACLYGDEISELLTDELVEQVRRAWVALHRRGCPVCAKNKGRRGQAKAN
jgi:hypothetical protein